MCPQCHDKGLTVWAASFTSPVAGSFELHYRHGGQRCPGPENLQALMPIETVHGTKCVHNAYVRTISHGTVRYGITLRMSAYSQTAEHTQASAESYTSVCYCLDPDNIHEDCAEPYGSTRTTVDSCGKSKSVNNKNDYCVRNDSVTSQSQQQLWLVQSRKQQLK